ncbi:RNA-directed DNA polymerase, eukaryota, reverse transcriptase zinc-binding domain protein [Tanacetum coccineum]
MACGWETIIHSEAGMCMQKPEPSKVPLWVKIMNIPLEAWNSEGISWIASYIGNPVIMDRITTSMCERSYGRASLARVLIEVETELGLVDEIEVFYNSLGRSMKLRVEYPWKPPVCSHCKVFGHGYDRCPNRARSETENRQRAEMSGQRKETEVGNGNGGDDWQTVNGRRSFRSESTYGGFNGQRNGYGEGSSRGGFNGRGRGGFGGRGFGDQRYSRNENSKYVPVKKNNNEVGNNEKGNDQNKGKNKVAADIDGGVPSNHNDGSSNKKGSVENGNNKKKVSKEDLRTDNMFSMLTDEVEIEKRMEWDSMKTRIDEACEKGLHISKEEREEWNEEVYDYYKVKLQELVKKTNVKDLKLKISNLYRQIAHSNKMVAIESRNKANSMCKSVMILTENQAFGKLYDEIYKDELQRINDMSMEKQLAEAEFFFKTGQIFSVFELETWSDEKLEFYKNSIGEEAFEKTLIQIKRDCNEGMCEDVAEDLSGTAQFMARNVVTNGFDADLNQMQGMKEFVECIEDLEMEDINMSGMFYTWIQRMRNPELDILKKLDRIMGNSHFIAEFPASYANFMPYLSSDHCLAVLCMPDVAMFRPKSFRFMNFLADKSEFKIVVEENWNVDIKGYAMFKLVKRLKAMKKHMRRLNRRNGNVFDKVKFLKTKLSRVQECLDKDPSSSLLREGEMVYDQAYKEAMIDEEKLLRQKTKVEWLKEGDANSTYFHNVIKGRVSKNRIEVVYDGAGNAYYGDKVAEQFVDLIKDVSDLEIKEALFSIEDNKASGPDGYTSKFFKASWSVVEQDVCVAISLIPKVCSPAKVTDYRPISSCNIVYKAISKVITNRIKLVLCDLVDLNQSAFILDRLISDNILLAQEFMKGYNWDIGVRNCAFKIDIQKAYDTVSWKFLEFCLKEFGFHPVMIHWIMVCLTTAPFSVCINGDTHGFFKAKRGLRHGDPISPYLFTLVMEVLNLMVKRHVRRDRRFKYHSGCQKLGITSLLFADDLLMLCHGDMVSASILRRGLDEFSMSSGLYPSMTKSNAFFCNIPIEVKDEIRGMSWSWKHLLGLRDKIMDFVNVKLGNGKSCIIWFDKWHSRGPLSKLIDHRTIGLAGLDINAKVIDLIDNNSWSWPIDWVGEYDDVLNVPVPALNSELEDRTYWCNKKGKEKQHAFITWLAVKERLKTRDRLVKWFSINDKSCLLSGLSDESHSHLFFSCPYSRSLKWVRLVTWSHGGAGLWDCNRVFDIDDHRIVRRKGLSWSDCGDEGIMVLAGLWMANNDLDNCHLFDSLCTGRGEFLKEWATYDYYIVVSDGSVLEKVMIIKLDLLCAKSMYEDVFKEANLSNMLLWHFPLSVSLMDEWSLDGSFQVVAVYGDGSGDSDWPQDSLMIQSMLVSFG